MYTPEIDRIIESATNRWTAIVCEPGLKKGQYASWQGLITRCRERIVSIGDSDPKWVFWITSQRGTIDIFGDYEDWFASGEVESQGEFQELWLDFYPEEVNWHQVTILLHKNEVQVLCGQWYAILYMDQWEVASNGQYGTVDLLGWILGQIRNAVECFVSTPTKYNEYIMDNLPNSCRLGKIKRSVLWDYQIGKRFDKELGEATISKLEIGISETPKGRETLSASEFFGFCEICYDANGYFGEEGGALSPREKYIKMADHRHGGLLDLPPDNSSAFAEWFHGGEWQGAHPWEICRGGSSTRILLVPFQTSSSKWNLWLVGFSEQRVIEVVRMAHALLEAKVSFELERAKEMMRMIRGEDYVGIVPQNVMPIYCHDLFPDKDIFFFINPWMDSGFPEAVLDHVEWQEIPLLKMREGG